MKKRIVINININKKYPSQCGQCQFRASDCIIFGFFKKDGKEGPYRKSGCLRAEIKE